MSVTIKQLHHTDAALWPLIGPIVTNREAHKELGGPLLSDDRTMWWVAVDGHSVVGCCSARVTDKGIWVENSWVAKDRRGKGVHKALCAAREKWISKQQTKSILVCCRAARWPHYKKLGFTVKTERGSWIYGEKQCQTSK